MIDEQHVINLIKGDFEERYGIPIKEFLDIAHYLFENKPHEFKKFDNIQRWKELTKEQKVVRLVKGGFEIQNGMPFVYFLNCYKKLIEDHPEKLI